MPWLIWVCPLQSSVHCQEHKLGDGRDREVMLPWHSRFSAASAETHMSHVTCHGLLRLIHDGDVAAGVGDPLVCAAAVWRSVVWRVTHPALPPPGAAWVRLNAAFINTSSQYPLLSSGGLEFGE